MLKSQEDCFRCNTITIKLVGNTHTHTRPNKTRILPRIIAKIERVKKYKRNLGGAKMGSGGIREKTYAMKEGC